MPEEINRVVTDHVCDLLFTPRRTADENLRREGIAPERIHRVGNVMIDTLVAAQPLIERSTITTTLGLRQRHFGVLTLHRPSTVDHNGALTEMLETLATISQRIPLVFQVHPRTRRQSGGRTPRGHRRAHDARVIFSIRCRTATFCVWCATPPSCSPTRAAFRKRPPISACPV